MPPALIPNFSLKHILVPALLCLSLFSTEPSPIQVGLSTPPVLDLGLLPTDRYLCADSRDELKAQEVRSHWQSLVAPYAQQPILVLKLSPEAHGTQLLLAASQALLAQYPEQKLWVAYTPNAPGVWDESAWGAVHGGYLSSEELGKDARKWRALLAKAQEYFPGKPWFLHLDLDPGPLAAALLGDGGRLLVPKDTAASRLASAIPTGSYDIEGGPGDLSLRYETGSIHRWIYAEGEWKSAPPARSDAEVGVADRKTYDVGALLARMRAAQLRERLRLRTLEATVSVDLHIQGERGPGGDLGFRFKAFERAGDSEELLQEEVLFNGVKANIQGEVQLPIVESRTSMAQPVALSLQERYRYRDGGPGGPGLRRIRFEPVEEDPTLFRGELLVDEKTGQIHQEQSSRDNLPGTVRSEQRELTYGSLPGGAWRIVKSLSFERWLTFGGISQVQRRIQYSDCVVNNPDFDQHRETARNSHSTMLKNTPEGMRHFTRQSDGSRKLSDRARTGGWGLGAFILVNPGYTPPVFPVGGLAFFDFNAWNRGIQYSAVVAGVYNSGTISFPKLPGGIDAHASGSLLLLSSDERPIENGKQAEKDAVGRRTSNIELNLGKDLPWGFRLEAGGSALYDHYNLAQETKYRTADFQLPPSGWMRALHGAGNWLHRGFQLRVQKSWGQRPKGCYGTPTQLLEVPNDGRLERWAFSVGYDYQFANGSGLHLEGGHQGGRGFDRFYTIAAGRAGGFQISGIKGNTLAADRMDYVQVGSVIPTGPKLRLGLNLDYARARSLEDNRTHTFTGLGISGDLPGFWYFTAVRVNLGMGLQSSIDGARTVNGLISFLRVF